MRRLVAVVAQGSPAFVDALRRAWDQGDAVFPLDPRLPAPAARALLDGVAPAAVVAPDGDASPLAGGRAVEDGDALVVATSGTSGVPRAAVLTTSAVSASAAAVSTVLGVEPAADRWLACLPLAHIGGLAVVTRALATGTALELHPSFDAGAVEAAARTGATLVSLVATALARIDSSLFRRVLVGGSAPPATLPANVVATWGMTETGGGVVHDGRPLPGVEVRERDGELHVRGPMLLRCYRSGTDPKDAEGWLATGDGGSVAVDGTVRVMGRLADVVVTGGEKVWPEPVEEVLRRHPAVGDVAVTGRADAEWGAHVVALVVAADPADPPGLDQLRQWSRRHLPAYAAPREIVVVGVLPRTASGKLRRDRLRGML